MSFPLWILPLLGMAAVLAWAVLMPLPADNGAFPMDAALSVALRAAVFVVATLVLWLAYFAYRTFAG